MPARADPDNKLSLADVLQRIDADRRLSDTRKREYRGAVRSVCSMLARAPEAVAASVADIERQLAETPHALRKQSRKTLANTKSRLKAALLHISGAPKLPPHGMPLTPDWRDLYDRLPEQRLRHGLSRLVRIASHQGVSPAAVDDTFMRHVIESVKNVNYGRDAKRFWRNSVAYWNEATTRVPGWPTIRLTPPLTAERARHLPLDQLPASFQRDLDTYLRWASGADRFAERAPKTALKATTIQQQRAQLRIAASILAKHFDDPQRVSTLAILVEPANMEQILLALLDQREDRQPTAFIRGVALTLVSVANNWLKVPEHELARLKAMKSRLGTTPSGLTAKNRGVVRRFDEPLLVRKLLLLPDVLMTKARSGRLTLARRLQKMQIALAIDLLLVAPMRMQNLGTLRLDHQLQWPTGRGGPVFISLPSGETKNALPLEYPIEGRSRALLHDYLDHWRVHVRSRDSRWLFARLDGSPVPLATLRDGITKAVKRELGIAMTPHQFRHLAAKIVLDANPGAIALVKDLLGHRNIKTTLGFYAGMRTREAALAYDQILEKLREDPEPVAS
jgi:integrase